jgi:methylglutaconyl-CoA hydratase
MTATSYNTLKLSIEGGGALLTLNRPEKRNALSPQLIEELLAALDAIEAAGAIRVLIITGEGQAFCSGMDLEYLKGLSGQSEDQNRADARRTVRMFRRLWSFPKPIITAVNGPAMAGGCGIATLGDFTLASEEAKFGYTEVRIGFMPALISAFLQLQVGEKIARDLLLSGRVFSAGEAQGLGLVTKVVPASQLLASARELATTLTTNSPSALRATKRLLVHCSQAELIRRLELGVEESVAIRNTADFREGLAAFLEKRQPKWST